jgi:hypothetical protein
MIGDRDPIHPFCREHAFGGAAPVDGGDTEAPIGEHFIAFDVVHHLGHGGGLEPQVHFDFDGVRQGLDDGDRSQPARGRMEPLDLPGGEAVAGEVAAEPLFDAGPQDLDGDVATALAIDHHRFVHLGDRRCRNGWAELGKMILDPAAQRFRHGRARFAHGKGRQLVLQVAQILGELGTDQIGARRQELPELDVTGAQPRQGVGHPRFLRLRTPERPRQDADGQRRRACHLQHKGHARALRHEAHPVLGQHRAGAAEPEDVAECRGHRDWAILVETEARGWATLPQAGRRSSGKGVL